MTDNIEKRVEKLMSECECTGYTCRHETSERHAIVFDIDIEQALKETRKETLREVVEWMEKDVPTLKDWIEEDVCMYDMGFWKLYTHLKILLDSQKEYENL